MVKGMDSYKKDQNRRVVHMEEVTADHALSALLAEWEVN